MSGNAGDGSDGANRTVFRPSPLQQLNQGAQSAPPPPASAGWSVPPGPTSPATPFAPPPVASFAPPPAAPAQAQAAPRLLDDDVPQPRQPQVRRNVLVAAAGPVLSLAASVRAGRVRAPLPELHRQATNAIAAFERDIAAHFPDETRMRAKYAVCATVDDIVQNLPGTGADGAEWARRSMVVSFFQENIGGDRFWQLTRDMLARPSQNLDLIELYHACLAAGFEGKYRFQPGGGGRGLQDEITALYAALEHTRGLSSIELVNHWKGETAPLRKVGLWNYVLLAAAAAVAILLLIYILLRLLLMSSGGPSSEAVGRILPDTPLRLSRAAAPPPPAAAGTQLQALAKFLDPEIRQGLVEVKEDASTVRVRTTVGQLFQSGSDQLEADRAALFERIGTAIETQPGTVTIEGHSDSDKLSPSLSFPDNMALSKARAGTVAAIVKSRLSDASRVETQGFGETRPLVSNATADGKSRNRRVEIVVPRHE